MPSDPAGDPLDLELLDRYLTGSATPDERARVESLRRNDPTWRAFFTELPALLEAGAERPPTPDPEASWRALSAEMQRLRRPALVAAPPKVTYFGRRSPYAIWAARTGTLLGTAACLGVGVFLLRAHHSSRSAPAERRYATAGGERATLHLTDGTSVILGPATTLVVSDFGAAGPRDVALDGEAYFKVRHDPARPFRVHAAGCLTEDIGTAFDVRAYAADTIVRVVVADGAVALRSTVPSAGRASLFLHGGELGVADRMGRLAERMGIDPSRYTAWTTGRVVFVDAPLSDVMGELSRWFGLDIRLAPGHARSLGSRRLTAAFAEAPADDVLDLVAPALGLRYMRQGDTVTLAPTPTP